MYQTLNLYVVRLLTVVSYKAVLTFALFNVSIVRSQLVSPVQNAVWDGISHLCKPGFISVKEQS